MARLVRGLASAAAMAVVAALLLSAPLASAEDSDENCTDQSLIDIIDGLDDASHWREYAESCGIIDELSPGGSIMADYPAGVTVFVMEDDVFDEFLDEAAEKAGVDAATLMAECTDGGNLLNLLIMKSGDIEVGESCECLGGYTYELESGMVDGKEEVLLKPDAMRRRARALLEADEGEDEDEEDDNETEDESEGEDEEDTAGDEDDEAGDGEGEGEGDEEDEGYFVVEGADMDDAEMQTCGDDDAKRHRRTLLQGGGGRSSVRRIRRAGNRGRFTNFA